MSAAVITACSKAREHEMKTMAQGEKTPNHITQSPVLLALSHSVVPSLSQATSVVASCGWWQGAGIIFAFGTWCVCMCYSCWRWCLRVCVYVNVTNRWSCPPTGDGWLWELWALNCFIWFRPKWIFSSTHCLLFVLAKIQIVSLEGYVWSKSSHVRPSIIK